jgi:hypothetical protein
LPGGSRERDHAYPGWTGRINRQGEDFFIETQNVAPPDSRIELISAVNTDWNALQSSLLKLRLSSGG